MANLRTREIAHRRRVAELRERKRLRRRRAEIHAAMEQAIRLKKSRKRGTSDLDVNMERLGYRRVKDSGPVEEKYEKIN